MEKISRLAFIDLDGTLLNPKKEVSPENHAALEKLHAANVQTVIASGRHHQNIVSFSAIGKMGWVLSSQGSLVRHAQTGEILLEMTIAPEKMAEICSYARTLGMSLIAYHRDGAYIERITPWTQLYARKAGWIPQLSNFDRLPQDGFQKIIWTDEPARIAKIAPGLKEELRGQYDLVVTEPELLEFLTPGANKAAGAQALSTKLGIQPKDSFAFGDGNNDVEILQWAGVSVAMRHGSESARKAARFVSPEGPLESAFARAVDLALNTVEQPAVL